MVITPSLTVGCNDPPKGAVAQTNGSYSSNWSSNTSRYPAFSIGCGAGAHPVNRSAGRPPSNIHARLIQRPTSTLPPGRPQRPVNPFPEGDRTGCVDSSARTLAVRNVRQALGRTDAAGPH